MLKMLRRLIGENIRLSWMPGRNVWPVKIDPTQIAQVLANLCTNARDAVVGAGEVTIQTGNVTFGPADPGFLPGDFVMLAVADDGAGMDKETLAQIFEPFFTTKGVGEGTGLGLPTVYGIVRQNQGFIDVRSEPSRGTVFKIYLPRHTEKSAGVPDRGPEVAVVRGRETILLVEDEPAILRIAKRTLESLGYTVLAASTPGEAIRIAQEHRGEIHLLITDVVMPEMNGRTLAKRLLSLYPDLKRVFMSGYTPEVIAHHGVLEDPVHFLQKPFTVDALAQRIREALGG